MDDADALLRRFDEGIRRFLARAGKAQHHSGVFDLRRRTLLGCYVYFDHLPWAIREMAGHATPEEIGRAGRGLCGSPFGAQIHGLLWAYLLGRENELALGRPGGSVEDLQLVIDWWHRLTEAYRDGEQLLPHENGDRQRATTDAHARDVLARHGRPPEEVEHHSQVTAGLQLYNYVLRGEQRGTTNFHGPYAGDGGRVLLVEEFTRLRGDELPWSADPPVMPLDTVCAVLELEEVELRFDLFQGMAADPVDYRSRLRRVALLTCDDGAPRGLTVAERLAILEACKTERPRLFRDTLAWDADYKIVYGTFHYLDFLMPFLVAAGVPAEVQEEARRRAADTARDRLREVAATEPVPVFTRLFADPDRLFAPVHASVEVAHG